MEPFSLAPGLDVFPILHGKAPFAMEVRRMLGQRPYAALALALPNELQAALIEIVEQLPKIQAIAMQWNGRWKAYLPADPCDAYIEGTRQALQRRIPIHLWEGNTQLQEKKQYVFPDANLLPVLGLPAFRELVVQKLLAAQAAEDPEERDSAQVQLSIRSQDIYSSWQSNHASKPTLLLCDFPLFLELEKIFVPGSVENTLADAVSKGSRIDNSSENQVSLCILPIKPGHLYFALGELPHYTGELEKERQDPLAEPRPYFDLVKSLFLGTRSRLLLDKTLTSSITTKKVQTALTFTRNLTAMEGRITPGLLELVGSARGVFGHTFAAQLLEAARHYPFTDAQSDRGWLELGRTSIRLPDDSEPHEAFNLFDEEPKTWKIIRLRRDPDKRAKQKYRYQWKSQGLCSHVPEDIHIERVNRAARARGRALLLQDHVRSEPLTSSLKDGIDMRATLRDYAVSKRIHVREIPPARGDIDTVVFLFDEDHDELYPFKMAWAFEHQEESMLTFYGTDPFEDMVGPGIARAKFGGLSLLFPPRQVPDIFQWPASEFGFKTLAEQLIFGALRHSHQKNIALISAKKPGQRLRQMAAGHKKHLIWIPQGSFSAETWRRLRHFHVLNGQKVRAWASRYIQE